MKAHLAIVPLAAALLSMGHAPRAAIVEGSNVAGIRTFVDTSTGTVWADLDNHLELTGNRFVFRWADRNDYLNALQAAGFVWATSTEVGAFTATTPLNGSMDHIALGRVMGSLSFFETGTLDGTADLGAGLVQRHFGTHGGWGSGSAAAWTPSLNDSGLWAYLGAPVSQVPEPGTLALAGLALWALAVRQARHGAAKPQSTSVS